MTKSAPGTSPIAHIVEWLAEAEKKEALEPAAMSVATVDAEGRPSLRMVLLRGIDERGLVFYTNLTSRKADDIRANAHVALCLHWKSMARQVRVEGVAAQVDDAEADAYFASRPRDSQIGAWALETIPRPRRTVRVGSAGRQVRGTLCHRRGTETGILVRLSRHAATHRVLGGPALSPARAHAVGTRRRRVEQS